MLPKKMVVLILKQVQILTLCGTLEPTGAKNTACQPHRGPLHPQRTAQPDDLRRELPQRTSAQGTEPRLLWLTARRKRTRPPLHGRAAGLPGPLPGHLQAPPQPQFPRQLQPGLTTPALSHPAPIRPPSLSHRATEPRWLLSRIVYIFHYIFILLGSLELQSRNCLTPSEPSPSDQSLHLRLLIQGSTCLPGKREPFNMKWSRNVTVVMLSHVNMLVDFFCFVDSVAQGQVLLLLPSNHLTSKRNDWLVLKSKYSVKLAIAENQRVVKGVYRIPEN